MQPIYFRALNKQTSSSNYFYVVPQYIDFNLEGTPINPHSNLISIYISNNEYWRVIDCPEWIDVEVTEYYGDFIDFIINVQESNLPRNGSVIFSSIYGDIFLTVYQM